MADVILSQMLTGQGFAHGFSIRTGGASEPPFDTLNLGRSVGDVAATVDENHARLAKRVGYDVARLFETSQVHGAVVRVIAAGDVPASVRAEQADALVAEQPGIAVGVRTADCMPVLIADVRSGRVAAVHAGWRGVVGRVIDRALDVLAERGSLVSDLRVAIGPHIRACCFEVGDDVAGELVGQAHGKAVVDLVRGKPHIDLVRIVRAQLEAQGLGQAVVDDVGGCTMCDATRYFSYRRDGARSGRHLDVIVART